MALGGAPNPPGVWAGAPYVLAPELTLPYALAPG
eukprot:CAMPEP_0119139404 /NCGR_PEP_ID=MMETSP1310-20130426/27439_1 /TAXON_ID=464262 /ORGANISM="Genus nov. species nov., Strain RCC2339" /LENGTH=33 /DNA_ID= /DNA_START= /DNA_END= /DNA_ORIENTATION=